MSVVYLGLGSNVERERNIGFALEKLRETFGEIECSSIYESESVGFDGSNFYNLVVKVDTDKSVGDLLKFLRTVEDAAGRDRSKPKFSPRTLDIDILLVDDLVGEFNSVHLPRDEVLKNAFVLLPLSEIAPYVRHPEKNETFISLWAKFDKNKQRLWKV